MCLMPAMSGDSMVAIAAAACLLRLPVTIRTLQLWAVDIWLARYSPRQRPGSGKGFVSVCAA